MSTVFTVESSMEFETCFHLEFFSRIETFEAQPEGYYYFEGQKFPYTPDFRVTDCKSRPYFLEVKPTKMSLTLGNLKLLYRYSKFCSKKQSTVYLGMVKN